VALGFSTDLRTARANAVNTFAGSTVYLRFYSSTRPLTTGGTATTLLVELRATAAFASSVTSGVLTLGTFTAANAIAGTATWFRIVKTDSTTHVMDGSVGTDLVMTNSVLGGGDSVSFVSMTITEGNA